MPRESESWKLWSQGLDHWRAARLPEAAESFREAIAKAAENDLALAEYYHSLGHLLDELGNAAEAQSALEKALEISIGHHNDNGATQVVMARCLLAEHHVRVLRFRQAIEVTEPSVAAGARVAGLLFYVRALAFHGLGQLDRARGEAQRAVDLATSPEQKQKFVRDLRDLLPPPVSDENGHPS